MKINRRRNLFYQRRTSNLYRLFALGIILALGIWFVGQMLRGAIISPFAPTPNPTRTVASWMLEGEAFFMAGDLESAITAYIEATDVDPENAQAWANLARTQAYSSRLLTSDAARLTRLTEALASADQAKALAPEDSNVLAIRAFVLDWNAYSALDALRTDGRTAADFLFEADAEALQALSRDSQNPLALAYYAEVLIDQQKLLQADQYIQPALSLGADVMDVHRVYAYYLESNLDYSQAIEEYQRALEINPNLTFLYISIGQNYRALAFKSAPGAGQNQLYELALENFAKAVRLNEQLGIADPLPYVAIAKTYAQQGEFFAAARNAIRAVKIEPANAELYGFLGNIYKRGRNYETSIIALQCAVEGCSPADACVALGENDDCASGTSVTALPLSDTSATYYLDYGSVLAAFSPRYPHYCDTAVRVLNQLMVAYADDPIIVRNAQDGLSICASVMSELTPTPGSVFTPTATFTPTPTP